MSIATGLPTYDSITSCAAGTGIPKHIIRSAKASGAPGFHSNRVNLNELLPWLFSKPDEESPIRWKDEYEKYRAKREKIRHDNESGKVIDLATSDEWILTATKEAASVLYQKLVNEMPSAVAGLDVPQARIYSKRAYNGIMASMRKLIDKPELKRLLEKHESDIAI